MGPFGLSRGHTFFHESLSFTEEFCPTFYRLFPSFGVVQKLGEGAQCPYSSCPIRVYVLGDQNLGYTLPKPYWFRSVQSYLASVGAGNRLSSRELKFITLRCQFEGGNWANTWFQDTLFIVTLVGIIASESILVLVHKILAACN